MADQFDSFYLTDLFMISNRHRKQQFIIFTTIQSTGRHIHIQLFRHHSRLVIQRNLLFINPTSHSTLRTDMQQF